jgi:hypothetical protein
MFSLRVQRFFSSLLAGPGRRGRFPGPARGVAARSGRRAGWLWSNAAESQRRGIERRRHWISSRRGEIVTESSKSPFAPRKVVLAIDRAPQNENIDALGPPPKIHDGERKAQRSCRSKNAALSRSERRHWARPQVSSPVPPHEAPSPSCSANVRRAPPRSLDATPPNIVRTVRVNIEKFLVESQRRYCYFATIPKCLDRNSCHSGTFVESYRVGPSRSR